MSSKLIKKGVYEAIHTKEKAYDEHIRKVAGRGGKITLGDKKKGHYTFTYTFK